MSDNRPDRYVSFQIMVSNYVKFLLDTNLTVSDTELNKIEDFTNAINSILDGLDPFKRSCYIMILNENAAIISKMKIADRNFLEKE